MAISDQSQHKSSVVRYKQLMHYRKAMTDSVADLARIHLDIAKAFDPEAGEEIDERLDRVKELSAIRKEMIAMELTIVNFRGSISRIFSSEGYETYDEDIARWKEMKEIRKQMAELHIDTTDIDTRMMNILEAPAVTQPNSSHLAALAQLTGLPSRKRGASVELESAFGTKRQAVGRNVLSATVSKPQKPDFWAVGKGSNWAISVHSICMGGALYHVGPEHMASLQPDTKTQTIQVYRSQLRAFGVDSCHSWISVTKLHSALFFSPKSVRKVIQAQESPKARIVLRDSRGDGEIMDVTFLEHSGVLEFVSKLKELVCILVEDVESKRMNELFANNRLRKNKVLI